MNGHPNTIRAPGGGGPADSGSATAGREGEHSLGHDTPDVAGVQRGVLLLLLRRAVHGEKLGTEKLCYFHVHHEPTQPRLRVRHNQDLSKQLPLEPPSNWSQRTHVWIQPRISQERPLPRDRRPCLPGNPVFLISHGS